VLNPYAVEVRHPDDWTTEPEDARHVHTMVKTSSRTRWSRIRSGGEPSIKRAVDCLFDVRSRLLPSVSFSDDTFVQAFRDKASLLILNPIEHELADSGLHMFESCWAIPLALEIQALF
jgi:hypothetical protein